MSLKDKDILEALNNGVIKCGVDLASGDSVTVKCVYKIIKREGNKILEAELLAVNYELDKRRRRR